MKIGIIGAGRAGTAFALALSECGEELAGISSRSQKAVDFISGRLGKRFINDISRTVGDSEVILLAVPDSAIAGVAGEITQDCDASVISGKTFLHLSGALTSAVLGDLCRAGGFTGSLHPIQTFASREEGWRGMSGIFFGFEGMREARLKALYLVEVLNGTLLDVKAEAKPLYHAAACVLSNYTVVLSYAAGLLLDAAGIRRDPGLGAFLPLLRNTVENIAARGSLGALTGPVARGDSLTISGHLEAMGGVDDIIVELYRAAGRVAARMALETGSMDKAAAERLLETLGGRSL